MNSIILSFSLKLDTSNANSPFLKNFNVGYPLISYFIPNFFSFVVSTAASFPSI